MRGCLAVCYCHEGHWRGQDRASAGPGGCRPACPGPEPHCRTAHVSQIGLFPTRLVWTTCTQHINNSEYLKKYNCSSSSISISICVHLFTFFFPSPHAFSQLTTSFSLPSTIQRDKEKKLMYATSWAAIRISYITKFLPTV